jgi:hypothetical protein
VITLVVVVVVVLPDVILLEMETQLDMFLSPHNRLFSPNNASISLSILCPIVHFTGLPAVAVALAYL